MILADENIPLNIITALRQNHIEVYSIYESDRGITDEAIIDLSLRPPRVILTEDKDFGEWVFAHQIKSISVVFLRYQYAQEEAITEILTDLVKQKGQHLFGKFITISIDKIRYRTI